MSDINQLFTFLKQRNINHSNDEWFYSETNGILFRISKEEREDEIQVWDNRGFVATSAKELQDAISLVVDNEMSAKEVSEVDVEKTTVKEVSEVDVKNTSAKEVSEVDVEKTTAEEAIEEDNPFTLVSSKKKKNSENGKMKDLGGGGASTYVKEPNNAVKRTKDPFRKLPVKEESEEEKEERIKRNEEQWLRTIDKLNENWEYLRRFLRKVGSSTTIYGFKISKNPMFSTVSEKSIEFWEKYGTIPPVQEFLRDFNPDKIEISTDPTSGDITFTRKQI